MSVRQQKKKAKNDAILAQQKSAYDKIAAENLAKLKQEQDEKNRFAKDLQAANDAKAKIESERKEADLKAKKEAEQLAKSPVKKQLTLWVDSFTLPTLFAQHDKATDIAAKFEYFKNWAKKEIESI